MRGDMMVFLGVFFIVVIAAIFIDHVRYWRQTGTFINKATAFTIMYHTLLDKMQEEFEGKRVLAVRNMYFTVILMKGDYKSFWTCMYIAAIDTMKAYDLIDSRYFSQMDKETSKTIGEAYRQVRDIYVNIRREAWKNGVNVNNIKIPE